MSGSRIVVSNSLPLAVGRAVAHGLWEMRRGGEWGADERAAIVLMPPMCCRCCCFVAAAAQAARYAAAAYIQMRHETKAAVRGVRGVMAGGLLLLLAS
jgi:hypothetical protein